MSRAGLKGNCGFPIFLFGIGVPEGSGMAVQTVVECNKVRFQGIYPMKWLGEGLTIIVVHKEIRVRCTGWHK
jgi:hypothetical protein